MHKVLIMQNLDYVLHNQSQITQKRDTYEDLDYA
jgi:hypothetical protein